jgi:tetratricopeptide (TPR) repeat protein
MLEYDLMFHFSIKYILSVIVFAQTISTAAKEGIPDQIAEFRPAVVTVILYNQQEQPIGSGHGFFVDEKGHLITSYHVLGGPVLMGAVDARVKTCHGHEYPVKTILAENRDCDLIMVSVEIPASEYTIVPVSNLGPQVNEPVYLMERVRSNLDKIQKGVISCIDELPFRGAVFQTTLSILPGLSGSAVFNQEAEVVGVARGHSIDGQNIGFGISSEQILEMVPLEKEQPLVVWFAEFAKSPTASREVLNNAYVRTMAGQYFKALKNLDLILQRNPDLSDGWYLSGFCYYKLEDYNSAIASFERSLQIDPDFSNAYYGLGLVYAKTSQWNEAKTSFERVIEIAPESAKAYFLLAGIQSELGHQDQAISLMKQAIQIFPHFAQAYYNLGMMNSRSGQFEEAAESFRQLILLKSANAETYYQLGKIYMRLANYSEAIEAFKEATKKRPDYPEAYSNIGVVFGELGYYSEAIDAFKQAIKIRPDYAEAYFNLGQAHSKLQHYELAIAIFKMGLEKQPNDAKAYYQLADLYRKSNQDEQALHALMEAVSIQSDYVEAHYELGLLYLKMEKETTALSEYILLEKLDKEKAAELYGKIMGKS